MEKLLLVRSLLWLVAHSWRSCSAGNVRRRSRLHILSNAWITCYFCSYLKNLHRAARLFESFKQHDIDQLPFYIAVPSSHLSELKRVLSDSMIHWLTQEEVFAAFASARTAKYENVPGWHRCSKSFSQKHGGLDLQKTCW